MKRFTTNLAIVAMILGSSLAFAFKSATLVKTNSPQNWYYDGSGSTTAPTNYTLTPASCPQGTANICGIVAEADPLHTSQPEIDAGLATRISNKNPNMGDVFLKH
jgi:hypothetical protein